MIHLVRWSPLLLGFAVIIAGSVRSVHSQSGIPPIPQLERLTPRGQLKATLRLSASRLQPGAIPLFSLLLENGGKTTIRIPPNIYWGEGANRRVFTSSGEELRPQLVCQRRRSVVPMSVRELLALAPGQSTTIPIQNGCGSELPPLPTGDYEFRATYWNYPDFPSAYDVYEDGGAETWDGEIETPPATFTVEPFDAGTTRTLIDAVENGPPAVQRARDPGSRFEIASEDYNAITLLGLNRTGIAVDALLNRFTRDAQSRLLVVDALSYINEPSIADRLVERIDRLSEPSLWRGIAASSHLSLQRLLKGSRDCDGVALLVRSTVTAGTARTLAQRCPDLRSRLEAIRDAPLPAAQTAERQRLSERGITARRTLEALDSPAVATGPQSVAQRVSPLPERSNLGGYVASILGPGELSSLALSGVTRFGTPEMFVQLRETFENGSDPVRSRTGEALAALTFHGRYRNSDLAKPAFWNQWWQQNRSRSREQWARDVLGRHEPPAQSLEWNPNTGHWQAAEYLVTLHRGSAAIVQELSTHRSWGARVGAANALVAFDRQRAGQLMLREMGNRYLRACTAAGDSLVQLTGQWHPFECLEMAQRTRATELWARDVSLLPSGPARLAQ